MQAGKIIYQGHTKSGQDVTLRFPTIDDVESLLIYINKISAEQTFIRFQGQKQTLEQEQKWLKEVLEKIASHQGVTLYAEINNQLVGVADINLLGLVENHIGLFGLTVAKEYRSEGVGTLLMEQTMQVAIDHLPTMKIIELSVFANNPVAIGLYEKLGFKEFGRLPEGILHRGEYIDHIYMFKKIR